MIGPLINYLHHLQSLSPSPNTQNGQINSSIEKNEDDDSQENETTNQSNNSFRRESTIEVISNLIGPCDDGDEDVE